MTSPFREISGSAVSPDLSVLIRDLAERLLSGSEAEHEILTKQLRAATLARVELTGAGLYAYFEHPPNTNTVEPSDMIGGEVPLEVQGLDAPAGCLLKVSSGRLEFLEIYTFGSVGWPDEPTVLSFGPATPIDIPKKAT